jgi:hypothetical protein
MWKSCRKSRISLNDRLFSLQNNKLIIRSKPKTCLGLRRKSVEYDIDNMDLFEEDLKCDIPEVDGLPKFDKYVKI